MEEKTKLAVELSKLSLIQKKIMVLIAQGQYTHLMAKDTLQKISTTSATVMKALKVLIEKDYIYETSPSTYRIVDPLIQFSMTYFFSNHGSSY
jgi:DNA-binding MarR family transcriptional regulator